MIDPGRGRDGTKIDLSHIINAGGLVNAGPDAATGLLITTA